MHLCSLKLGYPFQSNVFFISGNHTIAVINGSESRETLAEGLGDVFREVNAIQDAGHIEVDGKRVPVELFLGGDYKVTREHFWHYMYLSHPHVSSQSSITIQTSK